MSTQWLVNGRPGLIAPTDRGFAYGDGLFETMAAHQGRVRWLALHFARLVDGCAALEIGPPPLDALRADIAALCPVAERAVIKLIVTRGPGQRGYTPAANADTTRVVMVSPWPDYPERHYRDGITVATCNLRLAEAPALAGVKHLNRLEQVLAARELRGRDVQQGLLLDTGGRVVGGTSSNLFAVVDGVLVTPDLTRSGVRGVMRRAVIAAARELRLQVAERELTLVETLAANEVFMTNALFGIWPVRRIDTHDFTIGPIARTLMKHLEYGLGA